MTYEEIKKYLHGDCVVRNEKYEYKTSHGNILFYRQIGCEVWNRTEWITEYEQEQEWELVGKK